MNKRIVIESIIFSVLLMSVIIGWQVIQGYLSTQQLSNDFPSELSSELTSELSNQLSSEIFTELATKITMNAADPNISNGNFHIAYWSSPSILFGIDQSFGLDDLLKLIGVLLLFAALYYFIRKYVSKRKTARNK